MLLNPWGFYCKSNADLVTNQMSELFIVLWLLNLSVRGLQAAAVKIIDRPESLTSHMRTHGQQRGQWEGKKSTLLKERWDQNTVDECDSVR